MGSSLTEVERDGPVQLRATAALGVRHVQELRGLVARGVHGWEWCGDVGQGHLLRAQGGSRWRRQEEVRSPRLGRPKVEKIVEVPQIQYVEKMVHVREAVARTACAVVVG